MVEALDSVFEDSIPDVYDRYLVPLIFEQYAKDLALRTVEVDPDDVLEVAAGSGVVPRAVAAALKPSARYVVTDLNQPMLDRAESMQERPERIDWRQADVMGLPFDDGSFDLVLCQFGVMFFPDRVEAYREVRRVVRDGGVFVFNVWDRLEENEFAFEVTRALAEVFPEDPPSFLDRTPHGHYEWDRYSSELAAAGFEHVTIETVDAVSAASDPSFPAIAYCEGTPLRNEIEARNPPTLEYATQQATRAIRERFGDGPIASQIRAFVITAK
jgi:ubiquinone/menaquinone biosynthesis C-methylase UbiE